MQVEINREKNIKKANLDDQWCLDLIEKRNKEEYKKIQSQIRKKIRKAKEKESVERCAEMEIV